MNFEEIRYEVADHVLTITLNRPDRLNAFTPTMGRELIEAFDASDADDDVRAVIVTGAGRGFCAGADLGGGGSTFDWRDRDGGEAGVPRDGGGRISLRIFDSLKPVIAAINGPAVGVGITMTLPMDVRIAASRGQDRLRVRAARDRAGGVLVVVPAAAWWGSRRRSSGSRPGRVFTAEEALAGGLVRSVHPADEVVDVARALALEIAGEAAPVSVALARRMMWTMLGAAHPMEAHRADSRAMFARGQSADAHEGVTAFLEKRPPRFGDLVSDGLPELFPGREEPAFR